MRDIKFRAWDKNKKAFVDPKNLLHGSIWGDGEKNSAQLTYSSDVYLMQYTGLKDKNGKEIYEGDIVMRHEKFCLGRICQVVFQMGSFELHCSAIGAFNMEHSTEIMEIIGNIYQNPELIEVK